MPPSQGGSAACTRRCARRLLQAGNCDLASVIRPDGIAGATPIGRPRAGPTGDQVHVTNAAEHVWRPMPATWPPCCHAEPRTTLCVGQLVRPTRAIVIDGARVAELQ
jgi:hypothetical protein